MGRWNLRLTEHKLRHMHHLYIYICIYKQVPGLLETSNFVWSMIGGQLDHPQNYAEGLCLPLKKRYIFVYF